MSILNNWIFNAFFTGCKSFALPETAARGETFAALFAGDLAAKSTVNTPIKIPDAILGILILKIGISPKYIGLSPRKTIHKIQVIAIPIPTPIGIANRHHLKASLRTKRFTCLCVAPIHLINPKNSIRCATLLFKLLVIIIIAALRTRTKRTAAAT